ncbi:MAG TPA: ammonium transporter [Azospirillaceae bacterium]|nr:ammonium transporter [Azospirillaceae bacterium]
MFFQGNGVRSAFVHRAGLGAVVTGLAFIPESAWAADGADTGTTAWMITASALVLFMTLPGLALFYGGLVRARGVLSVLMHCFAIACLASVLWILVGYTLAFGSVGAGLIGGFDRLFLAGIDVATLKSGLPEIVFMLYQMTFAVITPALIVGAFVERIRFSTMLAFSAAWLLLVYAPAVHWIWGGGFMSDGGWAAQMLGVAVKDFAGGIVVHTTAGISALMAAILVGRRRGFPAHVELPHSPGMTMTGAGMLWVGWFGFNGGSALAADGSAGMAIVVTHLSAATAALTWMAIEWRRYGKPTSVGIVTGAVAGLATVTPAAGYIGPLGGLVCGLAGGAVCFYMVALIKHRFKVDDSLDVFAVHGVGGMLGSLLISVLALEQLGGRGLGEGVSVLTQFDAQLFGVVFTLIWSGVASWALLWGLGTVMGLRVEPETETEGLDLAIHGERAYEFN